MKCQSHQLARDIARASSAKKIARDIASISKASAKKERLLRVEAYQKKQKENETLAAQKPKLILDQQPTQKNKALGEFVLAARKERQRLNQPSRPSIRQLASLFFNKKNHRKMKIMHC